MVELRIQYRRHSEVWLHWHSRFQRQHRMGQPWFQHLAAEESTKGKEKPSQGLNKGYSKSSFSCTKKDRRTESKCSDQIILAIL